jgi:hypothetical protein
MEKLCFVGQVKMHHHLQKGYNEKYSATKDMRKILLFIATLLLLLYVLRAGHKAYINHVKPLASPTWWSIQSIDTMKYSRDLSVGKNCPKKQSKNLVSRKFLRLGKMV